MFSNFGNDVTHGIFELLGAFDVDVLTVRQQSPTNAFVVLLPKRSYGRIYLGFLPK